VAQRKKKKNIQCYLHERHLHLDARENSNLYENDKATINCLLWMAWVAPGRNKNNKKILVVPGGAAKKKGGKSEQS